MHDIVSISRIGRIRFCSGWQCPLVVAFYIFKIKRNQVTIIIKIHRKQNLNQNGKLLIPPPLFFLNMIAQQSLLGVLLNRLTFMSPPTSTGASRKGLACLVDDSIGACWNRKGFTNHLPGKLTFRWAIFLFIIHFEYI